MGIYESPPLSVLLGPFNYSSCGKPRSVRALLKQLLLVRTPAARLSAVPSSTCIRLFRNAAITCGAASRRTRLEPTLSRSVGLSRKAVISASKPKVGAFHRGRNVLG
jgi:hypothetical protein